MAVTNSVSALPRVASYNGGMAGTPITWEADHLGPGFQSTTLPLISDDEGQVCAVVVKYLPAEDPHALPHTPTDPHFSVLYIHGWNDYFYHPHLARRVAHAGGRFYALDLRKYGRALGAHQTPGYVTSLSTYDEDIHHALRVIRAENEAGTDLVMMAHSTGGLTAALWADRHPGALRALILNSPWLALQGSPLLRAISGPIASGAGWRRPSRIIPLPDNGFYHRSLIELGWTFNDQWRRLPSPPVRAGWLSAILSGHNAVARGLEITCPVLVMTSQATNFSTTYNERTLGADTVLDVSQIRRAALNLGPLVTLAQFEGAIHDVFLSAEPVRLRAERELERWIHCYV